MTSFQIGGRRAVSTIETPTLTEHGDQNVKIVAASIAMLTLLTAHTASAQKLELLQFGADSTSFNATATLLIGSSEVLLWDALMKPADATRIADAISATGKKLKAIVVSHPDHDHYEGVPTILSRFPNTPVYMTQAALDYYVKHTKEPQVMPAVLPSTHLTVDGEVVEVLADLAGDVLMPTNSVLWIPSLRTVLAGDLVFNQVHLWLGSSDVESRQRWRASLKRIMELDPQYVVAGHKRAVSAPDTPESVWATDRYLSDFDSLRVEAADARALRDAMLRRYPDYAVARLVGAGAMAAFRAGGPASGQ